MTGIRYRLDGFVAAVWALFFLRADEQHNGQPLRAVPKHKIALRILQADRSESARSDLIVAADEMRLQGNHFGPLLFAAAAQESEARMGARTDTIAFLEREIQKLAAP